MAKIPQYLSDEEQADYISCRQRSRNIMDSIIRFENSIQNIHFDTGEAKLALIGLLDSLKNEHRLLSDKVDFYKAIVDKKMEENAPTDFILPNDMIK